MAEIKSKSGEVLGAEVLQQLKSEIKGEIVVKGEAAESVYREAIDRFNKAGVAEAGIVVFPASEAEVAICLKFVQQHNIDLAVTCGRHNYFQASSTNGGLVIDLKKLKGVKIDTDNMRISAQGGCQAIDLEGPLTKLGMFVVMGAVNDTGIGGITLGGGTGPLTGQRGLIIDNLLAARVVVASGEILEASEEKNPDLFWAIRGGGGNFGVVTEFTYNIHKQDKIWWAILAFTPDKNKAFLELAEPIRQAVEKSGGKFWSFVNFAKMPGMPSVHPLAIVFYDGPEAEGMKFAQPFFDLGPAVIPKNETIDLVQLTTPKPEFLGPATHQNYSCSNAPMSIPLDIPVVETMIADLDKFFEKYGDKVAPSKLGIELRAHGKSNSVDPSKTAYRARKPAMMLVMEAQYEDSLSHEEMRAEVKKIIGKAKDKGGFVNANIGDGREKVDEVFGENYARLREVKRKYDPGMIFDKWYPIKPAEA